MPELPEVETTRRGIAPHLLNQKILAVTVREHRLRWPVPDSLPRQLSGTTISAVSRRAKYILIQYHSDASLLVHLGMSGSLRIVSPDTPPRKHDHLDLILESGQCLRFHDPRRFGCILPIQHPLEAHRLLASLGPEPLSDAFSGHDLYRQSRQRSIAVKNFIMNNQVVVGVGNIYASESLFRAGISPSRPANRISEQRYCRLAETIRQVLAEAIAQGGTTLRDFVNESGSPGYFQQTLNVYARAGQPCHQCGTLIRSANIGQRNSFFCPNCQH